jgi:dihydrodipicolinate synthase/N-acetylneuraminate lyase
MPRTIVLAGAALTATLTLAACGSGGGSGSAASPPRPCLQQYNSWNAGPAHAAGENLVAALNGVEAANAALTNSTTNAALKRAGTAATTLARYPIPKCADPKGYWRAVIVQIQTAAHNASTSGQGALVAAAVVLHNMPALDLKLANELKQTIPGLSKQK